MSAVECFVRLFDVYLCDIGVRERIRDARRHVPDTPDSRPTKSAAMPLPSTPSPRLRSGEIRHPAFFVLRRIPAGLTWLVDSAPAIMMPDQNPLALVAVWGFYKLLLRF